MNAPRMPEMKVPTYTQLATAGPAVTFGGKEVGALTLALELQVVWAKNRPRHDPEMHRLQSFVNALMWTLKSQQDGKEGYAIEVKISEPFVQQPNGSWTHNTIYYKIAQPDKPEESFVFDNLREQRYAPYKAA
jgi:hypothetical protein